MAKPRNFQHFRVASNHFSGPVPAISHTGEVRRPRRSDKSGEQSPFAPPVVLDPARKGSYDAGWPRRRPTDVRMHVSRSSSALRSGLDAPSAGGNAAAPRNATTPTSAPGKRRGFRAANRDGAVSSEKTCPIALVPTTTPGWQAGRGATLSRTAGMPRGRVVLTRDGAPPTAKEKSAPPANLTTEVAPPAQLRRHMLSVALIGLPARLPTHSLQCQYASHPCVRRATIRAGSPTAA
jgi:hypothetical protein